MTSLATAMHVDEALAELASAPSVQAGLLAIAPANPALVPAARNPDPATREVFDTWSEQGHLVIGVPAWADAGDLTETLWALRLMGSGWPDPAADIAEERASVRSRLLRGAARLLTQQIDELDRDVAIRRELARLERRVRDGAEIEDVEVFAFLGTITDESDRAQAAGRIAAVAPELAARAEVLIDEAGRLPITPDEAADCEGWLLGA